MYYEQCSESGCLDISQRSGASCSYSSCFPRQGSDVLWWACLRLCVCLYAHISRKPRGRTCLIFRARCLWSSEDVVIRYVWAYLVLCMSSYYHIMDPMVTCCYQCGGGGLNVHAALYRLVLVTSCPRRRRAPRLDECFMQGDGGGRSL